MMDKNKDKGKVEFHRSNGIQSVSNDEFDVEYGRKYINQRLEILEDLWKAKMDDVREYLKRKGLPIPSPQKFAAWYYDSRKLKDVASIPTLKEIDEESMEMLVKQYHSELELRFGNIAIDKDKENKVHQVEPVRINPLAVSSLVDILLPHMHNTTKDKLIDLLENKGMEPSVFSLQANKLIQVFADFHKAQLISAKKTDLTEWICKNFKYLKKGESGSVEKNISPYQISEMLSGKSPCKNPLLGVQEAIQVLRSGK